MRSETRKEREVQAVFEKCEYCGSDVRRERYPEVIAETVVRKKITPPPGAKDLGLYHSEKVKFECDKKDFLVCERCGGIWEGGGLAWGANCSLPRDHPDYYTSFHSVHPTLYAEYREKWLSIVRMSGARIVEFPYWSAKKYLMSFDVTGVDLEECIMPGYWERFCGEERSKSSKSKIPGFLARFFGRKRSSQEPSEDPPGGGGGVPPVGDDRIPPDNPHERMPPEDQGLDSIPG